MQTNKHSIMWLTITQVLLFMAAVGGIWRVLSQNSVAELEVRGVMGLMYGAIVIVAIQGVLCILVYVRWIRSWREFSKAMQEWNPIRNRAVPDVTAAPEGALIQDELQRIVEEVKAVPQAVVNGGVLFSSAVVAAAPIPLHRLLADLETPVRTARRLVEELKSPALDRTRRGAVQLALAGLVDYIDQLCTRSQKPDEPTTAPTTSSQHARCRLLDLLRFVKLNIDTSAQRKGVALRIHAFGMLPDLFTADDVALRRYILAVADWCIQFSNAPTIELTIGMPVSRQDALYFNIRFPATKLSQQARQQFQELQNTVAEVQGHLTMSTPTRDPDGVEGVYLMVLIRELAVELMRPLHLEDLDYHALLAERNDGHKASASNGAVTPAPLVPPPQPSVAQKPVPAPVPTVKTVSPVAPAAYVPGVPATSMGMPVVKIDGMVMVVDDGPDNRMLLQRVCERLGAKVVTADSGRDALQKVTEVMQAGGIFDLILMDIQMPGLDGLETTRQLRQLGYRGMIVAVTAQTMTGDRAMCIEAGCDDYAGKPFERNWLINQLDLWTTSGRARRGGTSN
jgi:CheY-like chemotaxis protein